MILRYSTTNHQNLFITNEFLSLRVYSNLLIFLLITKKKFTHSFLLNKNLMFFGRMGSSEKISVLAKYVFVETSCCVKLIVYTWYT